MSRLLEKQPGPPRLRGRCEADRFGFDHLTQPQQQKADSDTALYLKQLGLYVHAEESWDGSHWPHMKMVGNRVGFLLESPQDPKRIFRMVREMSRLVFGLGRKHKGSWRNMGRRA